MVNCLCLLFQLAFFFTTSAVANYHLHQSPIAIHSNQKQTERSCSYTVIIKTSCSSVSYTTDKLSLAFGDAHGNEVASRIDEPSSRTFERCSKYMFKMQGPSMDVICFMYLLRNGSDGWKPESIEIYGPDLRPIQFHVDNFLPDGTWFGIDACIGISNSPFLNFALF